MLNQVNPGGSGLRLAAALAARPLLVTGRTRNLLRELPRIAADVSLAQPSRRDQRFADPGWAGNPLLRRAIHAYLAGAELSRAESFYYSGRTGVRRSRLEPRWS